jgi:PIN domain nuclease of toxin-antitoxin system
MNLLLDTQVFLWLDSDQARLSSSANSACADTGNTLWLSAASAWEMQIKIGLGKLRLRRSLAETIASHQTTNGLQILPIQLAHTLALENLPPHHKDPFDRLLIAQASYEDWEIVTADRQFKAYPVRVIWGTEL